MIAEDYINFDIAKLLKEKGFDELTPLSYSLPYGYQSQIPCRNGVDTDFVSRITIQMAVKWLWEKYNLYVMAYPWKGGDDIMTTHWCCKVYDSYNLLGYEKFTDETPKSCEDAYESGIKYCLTKLI